MRSSPDRRRDRRRTLLVLALLFSLALHLTVGGLWARFAHRFLPASTPSETIARTDRITVEHRPPAPAATPAPTPKPVPTARPLPQRRATALAPALHAPALPTLAPPPRALPAAAPKPAPAAHAPTAVHLPRTTAVVARAPRAPAEARAEAAGAYSPRQLAALDAQFSRTIAAAQRALAEAPGARDGAAQGQAQPSTMKRYQNVMAGSRADLSSAQGSCRSTQTWHRGNTVWHYMDCDFTYNDGFSEHVFIPWPQHYPNNDDPDDHPGKNYAVEEPGDGFALPHPFAFSRLVCIFYKSDCQAVIDRERAKGDPDYAAP